MIFKENHTSVCIFYFLIMDLDNKVRKHTVFKKYIGGVGS